MYFLNTPNEILERKTIKRIEQKEMWETRLNYLTYNCGPRKRRRIRGIIFGEG